MALVFLSRVKATQPKRATETSNITEWRPLASPARRSWFVGAQRCDGFARGVPPSPPPNPRRAAWVCVLFRQLTLFERFVVAIGFHGVGDEVVHRLVEIGRHLAVESAEL